MIETQQIINDINNFNINLNSIGLNFIPNLNYFYSLYQNAKNLKNELNKLSKEINYYPNYQQTVALFEHNILFLEKLKQYCDFESSLNQFLEEIRQKKYITPEEYIGYMNTYNGVYHSIKDISCNIVIPFTNKCNDFISSYESLPGKINWTKFYYSLKSIMNKNSNTYFSDKDAKIFKEKNQKYLCFYECIRPLMPQDILDKFDECKNFLNQISVIRDEVNNEFMEMMLNQSKSTLFTIDEKVLDLQQRKAVITDEDKTLVIAGAGSGKTLTIVGKVKYLIEFLNVLPEQILLLSYTKKAALEVKKRIIKELPEVGPRVEVKTFHKFGLDIITKSTHITKTIIDDNFLSDLVEKELIKKVFSSDEKSRDILKHYRNKINHFTNNSRKLEFNNLKEHFEFSISSDKKEILDEWSQNNGDIYELVEKLSQGRKTLKNELLKSKEEVKIANFLFLNEIRYEYECDYIIATADENYRQYKPDFYLPDYDLYIEHFAIDENGKAVTIIDNPDVYEAGVAWKRNIHKNNKTTLVETYSYQEKNGKLLQELREKLECHIIRFDKPLDKKTLTKLLIKTRSDEYSKFTELIVKFITYYKLKGKTVSDLEDLFNNEVDEAKKCFYGIVKDIFSRYKIDLEERASIDFADAILVSSQYIKKNSDLVDYRYVIVDEYQDISEERQLLIDCIMQACNSKLFCVGDDWQSIYRFAGSDIEIFLSMAKNTGVLTIDKTYRSPQSLINIAGKFIMKDCNLIKKELISSVSEPREGESTIQIYEYEEKECIDVLKGLIENIVDVYSNQEEIYLLGRYKDDIDSVESLFQRDKNGLTYPLYPNLKISFMTVHKSKGLECDHVIILNANDNKKGFPCKIDDEPVLEQLLPKVENYPYAEERRLWYVAMTRSKKTCRIMVPKYNQSVFVSELKELMSQ